MDPTEWGAPYPIVVAALFAIVMARANGTYWLGRIGAAGVHRTRLSALMDSPGYLRATQRINTYGAPVVTLSFLTIGVQTLVNLAAGATGMPLARYLPAVTIGSVIWAIVYATLGTLGVDLLGRLYEQDPPLAISLAVLLTGAVVASIVWQVRRRTRSA